MLVADDLPELGTDLVTALAALDVNDLTHGWRWGEGTESARCATLPPPAPTHPSNARAAAPRPSCTVCATVPTAPLVHPRAFVGVGGQNACARSPPRRPRAPPHGHRGARAAFAVMGPAPGDPAARAATATRRRARASRMRLDGSRSPAHSRRRARPLRSYLSARVDRLGEGRVPHAATTLAGRDPQARARARSPLPRTARAAGYVRVPPSMSAPFPPSSPLPRGARVAARTRAHARAPLRSVGGALRRRCSARARGTQSRDTSSFSSPKFHHPLTD